MQYKSPQGVTDILPSDQSYFSFIRKVVRHRFRQAGFQRISVPAFEEAELFENAMGLSTKIIRKELYTFTDKQDRELSLRPEITPGVVRAFIQGEMYNGALPAELYYIDRVWRYQRMKRGNKREFWQFGGEILGESDPAIDAQLIQLGHRILTDLGIRDEVLLKVNTLGSYGDRQKYFEALQNFYEGKERSLTPHSVEMLKQGRFLQLLTPQSEDEEILVQMAPKMIDFLSDESREFYERMIGYLDMFHIEYEVDPTLVRPTEYYTHTVFEFRQKTTRNKIMVGGRYDGLITSLGGPDLGGAGVQCGMERAIDLMKQQDITVPYKEYLQIFVAATGVEAKKAALPILVDLREHGFHAVGALGGTSMIDQLSRAQKFKVPYAILLGDLELKENSVLVRDIKKGKSEMVLIKDLVKYMEKLLVPDRPLDTTLEFLGHK